MFYIGETGVSEELYVLLLIHLSDGGAVDVEGYSSSTFQTRDAQSALVVSLGAHGLKNVVSRQAGVNDGIAFIVGQYLTITTPALELSISSQKVVISSFLALSFPSTLHGLIGMKAGVMFGITLSDGTIWTAIALFDSAGHIVLPGLVSFSVSNTNVATVDSATGVVTLLDNNFELNVLRITSLDSAGQHVDFAFATNLDPDVGDIDLGEPLGLPLASMLVGSTFAVRVRAQLGATSVRSIQLHVVFDTSRLQILSVVQSPSWTGGLFRSNTDVVGVANFGGSCDATSGLFELAVIQFKVIGTGLAAVSGSVVTLADGSGASIPPSALSGRLFVAGNIAVSLTNARRSIAIEASDVEELTHQRAGFRSLSHKRRSGEVSCASKPCSTCSSGRQTGDTDGDCLFDVRDVTYQLDFLSRVVLNPSLAASQLPSQLLNLDIDHNGKINSQDASFLVNVNFQLYNFVQKVSVNVSSSGVASVCNLRITAVVSGGGAGVGDTPVISGRAFMYFDLESTSSSLTQSLQNAIVTVGSATGISKGPGFHGSLYRAELVDSETFVVELSVSGIPELVGISMVQGTLDPSGVGSNARTSPLMTGNPDPPYLYNQPASFDLVINSHTTVAINSNGYNPFYVDDNTGLMCVATTTSSSSSSATSASTATTVSTSTTVSSSSSTTFSSSTSSTSTVISTSSISTVSTLSLVFRWNGFSVPRDAWDTRYCNEYGI
jgi:hypothetical protein